MGGISAPHVSCPSRFGGAPNTGWYRCVSHLNNLRSSLTYPSSSFFILCSNVEFHLLNHFLTDIVKKKKRQSSIFLSSPRSSRAGVPRIHAAAAPAVSATGGRVARLTGAPARPSGWGRWGDSEPSWCSAGLHCACADSARGRCRAESSGSCRSRSVRASGGSRLSEQGTSPGTDAHLEPACAGGGELLRDTLSFPDLEWLRVYPRFIGWFVRHTARETSRACLLPGYLSFFLHTDSRSCVPKLSKLPARTLAWFS